MRSCWEHEDAHRSLLFFRLEKGPRERNCAACLFIHAMHREDNGKSPGYQTLRHQSSRILHPISLPAVESAQNFPFTVCFPRAYRNRGLPTHWNLGWKKLLNWTCLEFALWCVAKKIHLCSKVVSPPKWTQGSARNFSAFVNVCQPLRIEGTKEQTLVLVSHSEPDAHLHKQFPIFWNTLAARLRRASQNTNQLWRVHRKLFSVSESYYSDGSGWIDQTFYHSNQKRVQRKIAFSGLPKCWPLFPPNLFSIFAWSHALGCLQKKETFFHNLPLLEPHFALFLQWFALHLSDWHLHSRTYHRGKCDNVTTR